MTTIELHDSIIREFERALTQYGLTPYAFTFMAQYTDSNRITMLQVTANIKPIEQGENDD